MEVAPRQESISKPEPEEAQPEYVGALRGAAPARAHEERRDAPGSAKGARTYSALETRARSDAGPRASGSNAVVVGAAVAALVSSVVAAGLLLLTSGGQKGEGERRLTFYVPAGPSAATRPAERVAPAPASSAPTAGPAATDVQPLLQRADDYLRNGNPDEARVVLEQAAQLGSGIAALTLGAMYDPGRVAQFTNLALKADPNVARAWYERARNLGVAEASARLAELAAK